MEKRKNHRFEFVGQVSWDYFAKSEGGKSGDLLNISRSGCLFKTHHAVESRRWLRLLAQEESSQVGVVIIGRVVRATRLIHSVPGLKSVSDSYGTLYGIEFTFPNYFSLASTEEISALSTRNLMARSCLIRNSRSPLRPGFLA